MRSSLDVVHHADIGCPAVPPAMEQCEHEARRSGPIFFAAAAGAGLGALLAHRHAASALSELRRLAETDELTGLANRRCFLAALDRALADARHDRTDLSLALLDVDHFKRVNDEYGHAAGDEALMTVARTLAAETRAGDLLGRIGGEEFALLMPMTGRFQAHSVCERLRRAVAARLMTLPGGPTRFMTFSTGLAELIGGSTARSLMERADQALYVAKASGRNVIRLAA